MFWELGSLGGSVWCPFRQDGFRARRTSLDRRLRPYLHSPYLLNQESMMLKISGRAAYLTFVAARRDLLFNGA